MTKDLSKSLAIQMKSESVKDGDIKERIEEFIINAGRKGRFILRIISLPWSVTFQYMLEKYPARCIETNG